MFVTDPLDIVFPVPVVEHRWALQRFDCDNFCAKFFFQPVARTERPGRTRRGDKSYQAQGRVSGPQRGIYMGKRRAADLVVANVIREFRELVQNKGH